MRRFLPPDCFKKSGVSEPPNDKWCRRWLTQPGFPAPSSSFPLSLTSQEEFLCIFRPSSTHPAACGCSEQKRNENMYYKQQFIQPSGLLKLHKSRISCWSLIQSEGLLPSIKASIWRVWFCLPLQSTRPEWFWSCTQLSLSQKEGLSLLTPIMDARVVKRKWTAMSRLHQSLWIPPHLSFLAQITARHANYNFIHLTKFTQSV